MARDLGVRGDALCRQVFAVRTACPSRVTLAARGPGTRRGASPHKYCGHAEGAQRAPTMITRLVPPGNMEREPPERCPEGTEQGSPLTLSLDPAQNSDHLAEDGGVVAEDRREGRVVRHEPHVAVALL